MPLLKLLLCLFQQKDAAMGDCMKCMWVCRGVAGTSEWVLQFEVIFEMGQLVV